MANAASKAKNIASLNAAKAAGGSIPAPSVPKSASLPSKVGGAVTLENQGSFNPADRYGSSAVPAESIDTAQPSPSKVNATPFTAQDNLKNLGYANPDALEIAGMQQEMGKVVAPTNPSNPVIGGANEQQIREQAAASLRGTPVPNQSGLATATASQAMRSFTPAPEPPSIVGSVMETDNNFDSILTNFDDVFSPPKQKESLVSEYQKLSKSLGIDEINAELVDAKRIIEGTEEDIRNEVTATGGYASESQVLAMANARNKSLIKNYNALLDTRNNAMTQLNTLMNLTIADRDAAQKEFDTKLNYAFKIQEFRQKAIDNSREGFNAVVKQVGYDGLLASTAGNPYEQRLIEQSLGLPVGGLARLASLPPSEEDQLDLDLKRANLDNIYSQIDARDREANSYGTISGKPQNNEQSKANGFADRAAQADIPIAELGSKFTGKLSIGGVLPNILQSSDRQVYEQAKRNFVTAVLRRESGASISDQEFNREELKYFPQAGDKEAVVEQKEAARNTAINNLYREADVLRPVFPGQVIKSEGKTYRVGSDGETLEEIK